MNILNEIKVRDIPGKVVGLVYITPEQARRILLENSNPNNRKIDNKAVIKYTTDMNMGNFAETTLLSFDANGMMQDGHTRMKALSVSNSEGQWFVMLHGAKNDRFIFDRGRGRTVAQNFNMLGINAAAHDVAITNLILNVQAAYANGNKAMSNSVICSDAMIQDFILENQKVFEKLHNTVARNGYMTRKAPVSAAIFQALKCGVDEDVLKQFSEVLNNGYMSDKSESAAITLRKQLEDYQFGAVNKIMYEHFAEEAIAAFITGTPRKLSFKGVSCPYTMIVVNKGKND